MAELENSPDLDQLLAFLQNTRGFDFGAYKQTTVQRRLTKRMSVVGVDNYHDYRNYLDGHSDEFAALFDTILINVTSFFRDKDAWDYVAERVVPSILSNRPNPEPIRVWCAGAASGEEAYTIAMLFAEAMGAQNVRDRLKIYATDADEHALNQARLAAYDAAAIESVPESFKNKYFDRVGNAAEVRPELRRSVIFGRHDLVQDAPISHLDLIACRNTLMYFTSEAQEKILTRFHFGLNQDGFLFLGKAEMLLTHTTLFVPVDLRFRVFSKQPRALMRDQLLAIPTGNDPDPIRKLASTARSRESAFEHAPVALIFVDSTGTLVLANSLARSMFSLGPKDIPRPFNELELSYRPLELRSKIEQAYAEERPVVIQQVERSLGADKPMQYLDVHLTPIKTPDGSAQGILIAFSDATARRVLQDEIHQVKQDLENAYEELQSSNEELQTTNEELQSSNEELQTTNEELQSTNEELETMNEELQSTNEELEAINRELLSRTGELDDLSNFLQSALDSLSMGVAVIDDDSKILLWNHRAFDLWGLRQEETRGRSLFQLEMGLPAARLATPIQNCLRGECSKSVELDATTRRGERIRCCISLRLLAGPVEGRHRVMLLMEDSPARSDLRA